MKLMISCLLLFMALITKAQTKPLAAISSPQDTLIISGSKLPEVAKFGQDLYSLKKITPGQKTFTVEFNNTTIATLFQYLELSTASHLGIEQLKNYIRQQLKPQFEDK